MGRTYPHRPLRKYDGLQANGSPDMPKFIRSLLGKFKLLRLVTKKLLRFIRFFIFSVK